MAIPELLKAPIIPESTPAFSDKEILFGVGGITLGVIACAILAYSFFHRGEYRGYHDAWNEAAKSKRGE